MAFQAQIIRISQVYEFFSTQSVPKKMDDKRRRILG